MQSTNPNQRARRGARAENVEIDFPPPRIPGSGDFRLPRAAGAHCLIVAALVMLGMLVSAGCSRGEKPAVVEQTASAAENDPVTTNPTDGEASQPSSAEKAATGAKATAKTGAKTGASAASDRPAKPPLAKSSRRVPMFHAPGKSFSGPLPALTDDERALSKSLASDVEQLAGTIGERNLDHYPQLVEAANFIERQFTAAGYRPKRQNFDVHGKSCDNIEAELPGADKADEIVIVGAHYDSNRGTPGADDNASGVAMLLTLARRLASDKPARTVRFVAFVNEEEPHFQTPQMGSLVYAKQCRANKDRVIAMLSLEMVGYYSDKPSSQHYPITVAFMYGSVGDFVGIVGNLASEELVVRSTAAFRAGVDYPSEGAALPEGIDGVGWSDHWSFWQQGYLAAMVTDTAHFRNPNYHKASDTPDTLDYDRAARVAVGLEHALRDLIDD